MIQLTVDVEVGQVTEPTTDWGGQPGLRELATAVGSSRSPAPAEEAGNLDNPNYTGKRNKSARVAGTLFSKWHYLVP